MEFAPKFSYLSFLFAIVLVFIEDLINFKALAKPAESQVDASLGLLATLFGQGLRALALTCTHFGADQFCTGRSTQVRLATQSKSTQIE